MKLKKPLAAAALTLLLAGCQLSPPSDNKFIFIEPKAEPRLEGIWSGTVGPYMMSLVFKPDGSGYSCWATNGKNNINRLKYDGKYIQYQEGFKQRLDKITPAALTVSTPNTLLPDYTFVKDNDLKEADPFCVRELPKLK